MVRILVVLVSFISFEQVGSAQAITMNPININPGTIKLDGAIVLPQGWVMLGNNVTVSLIPPGGGTTAQTAFGTANPAATIWNDGNNPAGPVVINQIPTGTYQVFVVISVKNPNGIPKALCSEVKNVNVP